MIRITRLLPLLCLSLFSSLIFCGEFVSDQDEPAEVRSDQERSRSKSEHSNSGTDSGSDQEDAAPSSPAQLRLSPVRRLSLPSSPTLRVNASSSPLVTTTTSLATTSSSLGTHIAPRRLSSQESKHSTVPFQQLSPKPRPIKTFRRRQSGDSLSSASSSTATQSTQSARSSSSISRSATAQTTNEQGSPEMLRRNLGGADSEIALPGTAPVSRVESTWLSWLTETVEERRYARTTVLQAMRNKTFRDRYKTPMLRSTKVGNALNELIVEEGTRGNNDLLLRCDEIVDGANENHVEILAEQKQELLTLANAKIVRLQNFKKKLEAK